MAFTWMTVLGICAQTTAGAQQHAGQAVAMIAVKHTSPYRIIAAITPTDKTLGPDFANKVTEIHPDVSTNSIVAAGTPEGLRTLREVVRLFDVSPKKIAMHYRLVRVAHDEGRSVETVLSDGNALITNDLPFTVGGADQDWETNVTVLPRIHGDGTLTIAPRFTLSTNGTVNTSYAPGVNRLKIGEKMVSTFGDPATFGNELARKGEKSKFSFGRAAYRLELKVDAIKD